MGRFRSASPSQSRDRSAPINRGEESRSPDAILRHFGHGRPTRAAPCSRGDHVHRPYHPFFFLADGGPFTRCRTSCPLSSMIHSTIPPRSNSIARATAEGKLMYHCSLSLRLISWTLVG